VLSTVGEADRGRGRHAANRGGGALTGWGAGFLVGARARAYYRCSIESIGVLPWSGKQLENEGGALMEDGAL